MSALSSADSLSRGPSASQPCGHHCPHEHERPLLGFLDLSISLREVRRKSGGAVTSWPCTSSSVFRCAHCVCRQVCFQGECVSALSLGQMKASAYQSTHLTPSSPGPDSCPGGISAFLIIIICNCANSVSRVILVKELLNDFERLDM